MPYRLAAFGDEISPDIQVEIDHLLDSGIRLCCLRGANAKGVLELEDFQVPLLKNQFFNRGVRFSVLASPIGKTPVSEPFEPELERFRLISLRARQFETRVVRIYSFRLPDGADPADWRDEVLSRLTDLATQARFEGLRLLLENARDQYGSTGERLAELLESVGAENLMATFDFANFVQAGVDPLAAWPTLKPWVKEFHIKDATRDGVVRPAGQGDGRLREVLADALGGGWSGLLTLEPHLDKTPGFAELDGGRRFDAAAAALKKLLAEIGA
jgi:sugar phosphate isomerase/epimerase